MKEKNLSIQQIKFCEELAAGKTQRDAYNIAYPSKTRKDTVTDANASECLSKPKIFAYYQSLQKQLSEKTMITRESQIKELEELKQLAKEAGEYKTAINAIEVQNKMLGLNEPAKLDLTSKGESIKPLPPIIVQSPEAIKDLTDLLSSDK